MDVATAIQNLKTGLRVKAKGKMAEDGSFHADEVSVRLSKEHSTLVGPIQNIDYESRSMKVFNREMKLNGELELIDMYGNDITIQDLKKDVRVKIKGRPLESGAFEPTSIKIKEIPGYNVDKVQGFVTAVDPEGGSIAIDGLQVRFSAETVVDGG